MGGRSADVGTARSVRKLVARCLLALGGGALLLACSGGDDDDTAEAATSTVGAEADGDTDESGLVSRFETGDDGWTIANDNDFDEFIEGGNTLQVATDGNPGGYVEWTDRQFGVTWYWKAPPGWSGDRSEYLGGTLSYDQRQSATTSQFTQIEVILVSGDTQLNYDFGNDSHPGEVWTSYEIPLDGAQWIDEDTEAVAGDAALGDVLAALDELWIRGEYREGGDTGGLDNVRLSTDPPSSPTPAVVPDAADDGDADADDDDADDSESAGTLDLRLVAFDGPDLASGSDIPAPDGQGDTVLEIGNSVAIDEIVLTICDGPDYNHQLEQWDTYTTANDYPDEFGPHGVLTWGIVVVDESGDQLSEQGEFDQLAAGTYQLHIARHTLTAGVRVCAFASTADGAALRAWTELAEGEDAVEEPPPPAIDVTGTWSSDYGDVVFEGEDGIFAGPYGNDGFVAGRLGGLTLIGYWFSDTSTVTCDEQRDGFDHWGRIVWAFDSDNTAFDGLWAYCDDDPDRVWNGARISDGTIQPVDDDVLEAETTPDSQREADPALVIAASQGDLDAVNAQLGDGADANIARESDGWTPLLFAAQDGYTDIVNALLSAGADVDRGTDDSWTALMIASQNGHEDTVAALLAGGANPRVGRSSNWTALHSASFRNQPGVVIQLIDAGAPLEAAEDGFTPLTIAAQEGADALVTLLLDAGARVDGNTAAGPTPLYMAVQNGHSTSVELLLGGGADPSEGGTSDPPMVTVGAQDRNEIAAILVAGGADVDQQRSDGFTALHWAAYRNNAELVQILLDLGASTSVTDNDGNTPLDIATIRESDEAAELLR